MASEFAQGPARGKGRLWAVAIGCASGLSIALLAQRSGVLSGAAPDAADPMARALEGALRNVSGPGALARGPQEIVGQALTGVRGAPAAPGVGDQFRGGPAAPGEAERAGAGEPCPAEAACPGSHRGGPAGEGAEGRAEGPEDGSATLRKVRLEPGARSLQSSSAGSGAAGGQTTADRVAAALAASPLARARPGATGTEDKVASVFRNFIKKLNSLAPTSGQGAAAAADQAGPGGHREQGGDGGETPVIRGAQDSALMASPSYRDLIKTGRDGSHGVTLFNKGMADGAKDGAGKSFDGILNTYAPIPIEKGKGTFGQTTINARKNQRDYAGAQQ